MLNIRETQKRDPLKKQSTKELEQEEFSPMSPPEAFAPPAIEKVSKVEMSSFLRKLVEEHEPFKKVIDDFENALLTLPKEGINKEIDASIREFFRFFDLEFGIHNRKEEKILFPLLHKRLLEKGEHSQGVEPTTAVDVLEGDHLKATQQVAVIFNFFALSHRLPDQSSRLIVLDSAIEQGKDLVEMLRLHIFREENVIFPLAHRLISREEFEQMERDSFFKN